MSHGGARKGAGRKKGSLNKASEEAKEFMVSFVGDNMQDMQTLFDQVKKDDPKKAFDILIGSLEYVVPKLSRTELKHEGEVTISSLLADLDEREGTSETKED